MKNNVYQLPVVISRNRGLRAVWVETGLKNQPLACIWMEAKTSHGREPETSNEDPAGLCVYAG